MEFTDEQKDFLVAEGRIVLHACPGSGKTAVVAQKLIDCLKSWDRSHQGIATLSFTNVASEEIEKQVQKSTSGALTINYPHYVGTLDSFINNFIVLRFGYGFLSPPQRPKIAVENLYSLPFRFWRSECHRKRCVSNISHFKWDSNGRLFRGKELIECQSNSQYGRPCHQYKQLLRDKGIVFQNEAAGLACELLKTNPQIAAALAARFPIIIVDEAQDTSEDQMAVLDLLEQAGAESVFLVGDPDQAIYEWRDASPEFFIEKINSEKWKVLQLTTNFRSSQLICNATKLFSKSLEGRNASIAKGVFANDEQKPILLLYDKENCNAKNILITKYLSLCSDRNIEQSSENVAIVTRKSVSIGISDLWKSKEVELFAKASHEWILGTRKKAYEFCEKALFSLLLNDLENIEITIENEVEKKMPYESWRLMVLDILINLPAPTQTLKNWIEQMSEVLAQYLVSKNLEIRNHRQILDLIKIKTRDQDVPNLQEHLVSDFLKGQVLSNYTFSSVHGVKGETYSALMLLIEGTTGNTLTPSFLNTGNLDQELMRIAYVAMSRPRKLLVVAMPNTKKTYARFPETLWDHMHV